MRRARDPICMVTVNKKPDEKKNSQSQSKIPKRDNVNSLSAMDGCDRPFKN
jgi:hypothetical protein